MLSQSGLNCDCVLRSLKDVIKHFKIVEILIDFKTLTPAKVICIYIYIYVFWLLAKET